MPGLMEFTTTRELISSYNGHHCNAWDPTAARRLCDEPATVRVRTTRVGGDPTFGAVVYRCPAHDPGPADEHLELVTFHNGTHGLTTVGPASAHTIGREQHDRVRACWINAGMGDWPATNIAPASADADLAVITAVLVQTRRAQALRDDLRVVGQAGLDGKVIDGVVYRHRRARPIVHLSHLAGMLEVVARR